MPLLTFTTNQVAVPMLSFEDFVAANSHHHHITMFEYRAYAVVRSMDQRISFDMYMAQIRDGAFIYAIDEALSNKNQEKLLAVLDAFIIDIESKDTQLILGSLICAIEAGCNSNNPQGLDTILQFLRQNQTLPSFSDALEIFRWQTKLSKAQNPSLYAFVDLAAVSCNVIAFNIFGLEVPEHFKDPVTESLMNCPVKLGGQVFDFDTLDGLDIRSDGTRLIPFKQIPFTMADVQPHQELYAEMRAVVLGAQKALQLVLRKIFRAIVSCKLDELKGLVAANPMLNLNHLIRDDFTLLHYACITENAAAIKFLVTHGAEMDFKANDTALSPHTTLHLKNPALALEIKLFCVNEARYRMAQNDPIGHLRMATMYTRGIIVELNRDAILFHLEVAGHCGDVRGFVQLADIFAEGKYGLKKDVEKAAVFYQQAIYDYDCDEAKVKKMLTLMPIHGLDFGASEIRAERIAEMAQNFDPDAQYLYSVMLRTGIGVTANEYNRIARLEKAAKGGCIPAMYEYSSCCQHGVIIPRNLIVAMENLKKAADGGSNYARYDYANHCLLGTNGVPLDLYLAAIYFKNAADDGFAPAQFSFSKACTYGQGVVLDPVRAAIYMQKAADNKIQKAQLEFAYMCMNGLGVTQNKFKAARYYIMVAENTEGNIDLANQAARMYVKMALNGDGIPQDFADAAKYSKQAADRGCVDSACSYAKLCAEGKVFDKGLEDAVDYLQAAADKGHVVAQYAFAVMCIDMQVTELTMNRAVIYYKKCANNPNVNTTLNLEYSNKAAKEYAFMCLSGEQITQDLDEALVYLRLAAARGCTESAQKLLELEDPRLVTAIPSGPSFSIN